MFCSETYLTMWPSHTRTRWSRDCEKPALPELTTNCERRSPGDELVSRKSGKTMSNPLRGEVVRLYKNLLYLGREYPKGTVYFRERLKVAFMKNKDVTDPEKIRKLIDRGEFVIKELEALYFLRKYRAMKKRYYDPEH
ncbi:hypothetical protein MHYP_G00317400 [Metynnis hypsauchen]